jgi:hypothetical protein
MDQAGDVYPLLAQIPDVGWVGGDFDGRDLVSPHVMMGAPDLGIGAVPHLLFQNIFPDALTRI